MGNVQMPSEFDRYFRKKAAQFRQITGSDRSKLARQLLALADEFDAKAAEIEAAETRNSKPR